MTKSLQEIQKENRKFILEAIYGCSYEEALEKEWGENWDDDFKCTIIGKPITLNRVLLALKDKRIGFYDDSLGEIWRGEVCYREDMVEYICDWDLKKETLEEQSEETQRRVNKLLVGI